MRTGGWAEVSRDFPCPACASTRWCTVAPDRTAVLCRRVESPRPQKDRHGDVAWYHPVNGTAAVERARSLPDKAAAGKLSAAELADMHRRFRADLSPKRLATVARLLGVTEASLLVGGAGWCSRMGAVCWPMRDGNRQLCGFRVRRSNAKPGEPKYVSIRGSRNGLFIPDTFGTAGGPPFVLVPEGPTDMSAAIGAGFPHAVGRPSNSGGAEHLRTLLATGPARDVLLVAEHDLPTPTPRGPQWPGWEGTLRTARTLLSTRDIRLRVVRVAWLPGVASMVAGKDRKVDLRDWIRHHGTAGAVSAVEGVAEVVTPAWLAEQLAAVNRRRAKWKGRAA